nr:Dihydrofolate reductase [uncultured bacterium]AIA17495.1 Dihydrofolate reductase [uncultured bacterium]
MIVSLIVALDRRYGIGKDNRLPWRLSADLKRFRELTMGHHLIVGRKTFESIGKPLPGRQMIIVTRQAGFQVEGCFVVNSIDQALRLARERGDSEVFVIGGAEIYAQTLALADRLYLTLVEAEVAADTFFPKFDKSEWLAQEMDQHEADEKNQYPFTFKLLVKT